MPLRIEPDAEPIPGYRLVSRLGGGGFGEVWKAVAPGGLYKAIKILHGDLTTSDVEDNRHAEQELRALKRVQGIRHPYLLSLERYDIIDGRLLITMELADCNLWDRFLECRKRSQPGIPRNELLRFMEESAEVLDLMNNEYDLQHLDIKPQNIFLIYNHVKVADFGLVKDLEGMRAAVTGGVTPVYAAPETFDGVVTRYCDQYSLAIVYQELLTGQRPFNGATMNQLLMQHLQAQPNLQAVPASDRPALARALAKKPEDRFPSCMDLVRAIKGASSEGSSGSRTVSGPLPEVPESMPTMSKVPDPRALLSKSRPLPNPSETPKTQLGGGSLADLVLPGSKSVFLGSPSGRLVTQSQVQKAQQQMRIAPPELRGDGVLMPALLIGLGQTGLEILRRFRSMVNDRYGAFEKLPNLRMIFIDTDPETVSQATTSRSGRALTPDEIIPAFLNKASHYLTPRRHGKSLIDGWCDQQLLWKIPRTGTTNGIRPFGRLAFLDHFAKIAKKMTADLESCTHPDALGAADRATRLGLRTNRPRVYIVAGLGGGTGSGMFLDAAYSVRHKLKQLGFDGQDIVGFFVLPPNTERPSTTKGLSQANVYAALTELHHYNQSTTFFTAGYDDRDSDVHDPLPPFRRFVVLPPTSPDSPHTDPIKRFANLLRREILTPFGRTMDDARGKLPATDMSRTVVQTFGDAGYAWPKQQLLGRASYTLGATLMRSWLGGDPNAVRAIAKNAVVERWNRDGLAPEALIAHLQQTAEQRLGIPLENYFATNAQPFIPTGWFSRDPEPTKLWQALGNVQNIVGMPDDGALQRQVGQVEFILEDAAEKLLRSLSDKLNRFSGELIENPDFRLAGAEAVVHQLRESLDSTLVMYTQLCHELGGRSLEAFLVVNSYLTPDRTKRKPAMREVADALGLYPKWRYQSLILRQVIAIYNGLRGVLQDKVRELSYCKTRLQEIADRFASDSAHFAVEADTALLPPGCMSIDHAVRTLLNMLTPDDMRTLDRRIQTQIEQEFNSLFSIVTNSVNLLGDLQNLVLEQTRVLLLNKLGEPNVIEMFLAKFPAPGEAPQRLNKAYNDALPNLLRAGAYRGPELTALGAPGGPQTMAFQPIARQGLPPIDPVLCVSPEEIFLFREFSSVPLTSIPQLGQLALDAYTSTPNVHIRSDVPRWKDIEDD